MTGDIAIERRDRTQVIRFVRPAKKNALTSAMYRAIADALQSADRDPMVSAHVFFGSSGVFTAGNDIQDFLAQSLGRTGEAAEVLNFIRLLPTVAKPMLAGVDGPAVGLGTTMLFHCDLVYATAKASFATPFLDLGLVPEAASSLLMPQRMGYARAFEMLVLGEAFPAQRMLDVGLVNAIIDPDKLEDHVLGAAQRLGQKPPEALAIARRLMRGKVSDVATRLEEEAEAFAHRLESVEAREAFQAFLEKRAPDFAKFRA